MIGNLDKKNISFVKGIYKEFNYGNKYWAILGAKELGIRKLIYKLQRRM